MNYIKPYNVKAILNNLNLVFKTGDINKLNKQTYGVLHLMSGFIAHYNLMGFQDHYEDLRELVKDIKNSFDYNCPNRVVTDPYFAEHYGPEYPKSKADIYNGMHDLIEKYESQINEKFSKAESEKEINIANHLAFRHGYKLVKE